MVDAFADGLEHDQSQGDAAQGVQHAEHFAAGGGRRRVTVPDGGDHLWRGFGFLDISGSDHSAEVQRAEELPLIAGAVGNGLDHNMLEQGEIPVDAGNGYVNNVVPKLR